MILLQQRLWYNFHFLIDDLNFKAQELEEAARIRLELEQSGQKLDQNLADAADRIAHLEAELATVQIFKSCFIMD